MTYASVYIHSLASNRSLARASTRKESENALGKLYRSPRSVRAVRSSPRIPHSGARARAAVVPWRRRGNLGGPRPEDRTQRPQSPLRRSEAPTTKLPSSSSSSSSSDALRDRFSSETEQAASSTTPFAVPSSRPGNSLDPPSSSRIRLRVSLNLEFQCSWARLVSTSALTDRITRGQDAFDCPWRAAPGLHPSLLSATATSALISAAATFLHGPRVILALRGPWRGTMPTNEFFRAFPYGIELLASPAASIATIASEHKEKEAPRGEVLARATTRAIGRKVRPAANDNAVQCLRTSAPRFGSKKSSSSKREKASAATAGTSTRSRALNTTASRFQICLQSRIQQQAVQAFEWQRRRHSSATLIKANNVDLPTSRLYISKKKKKKQRQKSYYGPPGEFRAERPGPPQMVPRGPRTRDRPMIDDKAAVARNRGQSSIETSASIARMVRQLRRRKFAVGSSLIAADDQINRSSGIARKNITTPSNELNRETFSQ
ncbi:unnamed protein product [Trichogramma brassicae]|uniref:Uncharacterized protein n=1 Tax=Trichogramma brassicae TaxID=86971 RepID=A0A6H5HYW9_9HYME|nr:unnamed protein product [Trichogramma brassicae]